MPTTKLPIPIIVDTMHSPHARLRPVPVDAVTFSDAFWAPRLARTRAVTLPAQYALLENTGRLDNFRRAAGALAAPFRGYFFNDSDVYKWLEGALWALAASDAPELMQQVETVIALILAAQGPDGYLNTYFTFERAAERWRNLRDMHELYCAGHFIHAAVAHYRIAGETRLLEAACRFADLICATFGPEHPGVPGHSELEMALVELSRATGAARYLAQARYFLDARGQGLIGGRAYHQDRAPLRELARLEGHAVRALYLAAGAADVLAEQADPALLQTLAALWTEMAAQQLYVTGGAGARHEGEAFGDAYELPNARAYAETCAGIAGVFWAWRMLALTSATRYADLLEWTLYNAVLPGIGLDGLSYFYVNPLQDDGNHRRQPWFDCACCPTNIVRLLAALPGYVYNVSTEGVWVQFYADSRATLTLPDGDAVTLTQTTRYPWDGDIAITVEGAGAFSLFLRIPSWCESGVALTVNGIPWPQPLAPETYAEVHREWRNGDVARLQLPMPVRALAAHPYALENTGRIALTRGPLVYCLEACDQPADVDLRDIALDPARLTADFAPTLLAGVVVLRGEGQLASPNVGWAGRLYRAADVPRGPAPRAITITAIPYCAWANRAPGAMQVWIKALR